MSKLTKASLWGARLISIGMGIVIPAIIVYQCWPEYRTLATLHANGQTTTATVHFAGMRKSLGVEGVRIQKMTEMAYTYSYQVNDQSFGGSVTGEDPLFQAAFQQKNAIGLTVGHMLITYLPENPKIHRIGEIDDSRLQKVIQGFWLAGGVFLFFGVLFVAACWAKPDDVALEEQHPRPPPMDFSQLPKINEPK